jgi:hypothetical protein
MTEFIRQRCKTDGVEIGVDIHRDATPERLPSSEIASQVDRAWRSTADNCTGSGTQEPVILDQNRWRLFWERLFRLVAGNYTTTQSEVEF